jgi:hypothetical protein
MCISFTLEGDVMHVLGKGVYGSNATGSDPFAGCLGAPVAADFEKNDGGGGALAATGADWAIVLRRTPEVENGQLLQHLSPHPRSS